MRLDGLSVVGEVRWARSSGCGQLPGCFSVSTPPCVLQSCHKCR